MTEIRGNTPLNSTTLARAAPAAAALALKLLQPAQGLLAPGQQASAEVVEVRPGANEFHIVLRLSLPGGREAQLSARSSVPVNLGGGYVVSVLSGDRLLAAPQAGARPPLERLDLSQLPIGTQIQARVAGSQAPTEAGGSFRLLISLLDGPLAGTRLLLDSARALPTGSLLTAQVQGEQLLRFVPLGGRLDQLAVHQQLSSQFARQGSLAGLFAALQGSGDLPDGAQQAAAQLRALLPGFDQLGDPQRLAQALAKSGLFMEATLAAQGGHASADDLKAGLLRLVSQLLPNLPGSTPLASAQASLGFGQALPAFARQMLGNLGQTSRALDFPLPNRLLAALDGEPDLETLLKLAAAAIARLQSHQLSSLAQTQTTADGLQLTTWQTELPLRNGQDITTVQAWIQREEDTTSEAAEHRETLWRLELAFDLAPLGPLQVQAQLIGHSLSSQLWAEQRDTARLIDAELPQLRARLEQAGLVVGSLDCREGLPAPGPRTRLEQRYVDETA